MSRLPSSTRQSPPLSSDERGIALAVAVFALVVIGALVAGTFFAGRLEQRTGLNTMFAAQSFELAEAGATEVLANWAPATFNALAPGTDTILPPVVLAPLQVYTPTVTRLTQSLYFVRATGQRLDADGSVLAERTTGQLARLAVPVVSPGAAMVSGRAVRVNSLARLTGEDQVPTGWAGHCSFTADTVAAVRAANIVVDSTNCSGSTCLVGLPPVLGPDSTVTSSLFTDFGGISFDELAAMAEKVVAGSVTPGPSLTGTGECDRADPDNWGEPLTGLGADQCFEYFPIVYAPGDLQLAGGRGQGILLVQGRLNMRGNAEFYGLIVVQEEMETEISPQIYGAVMAREDSSGFSNLTGTTQVFYSSCAIRRALQQAGIARPLSERAWAQVFPLN